jgi:hypothetical protein
MSLARIARVALVSMVAAAGGETTPMVAAGPGCPTSITSIPGPR